MDDATTITAAEYESDALAWAKRQAALLDRLARGQDVAAEIDWPHVIEEVADVGLSELRSVMSLLTRAMEHLLKIRARLSVSTCSACIETPAVWPIVGAMRPMPRDHGRSHSRT